jgi:hypothetical protein
MNDLDGALLVIAVSIMPHGFRSPKGTEDIFTLVGGARRAA